MHVGFNLMYLVPGEAGGTETYAHELLPAVAAAAPAGTRLTAFVSREAGAVAQPWDGLVERVVLPLRARQRAGWVAGEQLVLPRLAARAGVDVLHSLASTAPAYGPFRRVVTIHDLHYRTVPEAHFGLRGLGMRALVPLAARTADRVIAVSRATAAEISTLLGLPAERLAVIPHGMGAEPRATPLDEATLRTRLDLGARPVLLTVSAKRPHKNLMRLLEALALLPAGERPVLIMPGYPTEHGRELEARAAALGVASDVRMLSWVDASELEGLYAAAAAFVFPSLAEGFGLPLLEAMRRGVPVACSATGAVGEVAGNAALTFDPLDVRAIASALARLLGEPATAARLRAAGRARAASFTWERSARATLAAYAEAVVAPRPPGRLRRRRAVGGSTAA